MVLRIRGIINTSKKLTADITSIQICNKTVKNSYEIARQFNKHFTSITKQKKFNKTKT